MSDQAATVMKPHVTPNGNAINTRGEQASLVSWPGKVALAPMAGITDLPFRTLCEAYGAAWVTSEMVSSNQRLWGTNKSSARFLFSGKEKRRVIQIVGHCPKSMASAAQQCQQMGADVVDINMGCPAKKVCSKAAGSALLRDEKLVTDILSSVVKAVEIPVTLKYRTGWNPDKINAQRIARIAQSVGIQRLALHGRTRACGYKGDAEYDTIAAVVASVDIPVFANGDISTPEKAKQVLDYTGAAGVLIGRGAQGKPWVFREINHYLETGERLEQITYREIGQVLLQHLEALHDFYGPESGKRIARKHVRWYVEALPGGRQFSRNFNQVDCPSEQLAGAQDYLERLIDGEEMAA
jgi:tRNA-dihydrouridine synthase B